jgi:hypothetical protein
VRKRYTAAVPLALTVRPMWWQLAQRIETSNHASPKIPTCRKYKSARIRSMSERLRRTAIHESAHATLASIHHLPLLDVTINPDGTGLTRYTRKLRGTGEVECWTVVMLAGIEAELDRCRQLGGCNMRLAFLIGALCLFPIAARAEVDVGKLLDIYDHSGNSADKSDIVNMVRSIQIGMMWANAFLEMRNEKPLYCSPRKMALTGEQIIDMLRREVIDKPSQANNPTGLVMMQTFQEVFPCP